MKTKIVSVGELDVILPFKAIGAEIYPVVGADDARSVIEKLLKEGVSTPGDVGIILIPDDLVPHIRELLNEIRGKSLPCILSIPGSKGSAGFGLHELRELIKTAVGVDIVK